MLAVDRFTCSKQNFRKLITMKTKEPVKRKKCLTYVMPINWGQLKHYSSKHFGILAKRFFIHKSVYIVNYPC